jgi:hypothetical protein
MSPYGTENKALYPHIQYIPIHSYATITSQEGRGGDGIPIISPPPHHQLSVGSYSPSRNQHTAQHPSCAVYVFLVSTLPFMYNI